MSRATSRMRLVRGDITRLTTDAIVNAANRRLEPGGGVCGAIHRAAGPKLARACRELGECAPGEARITPGFELPSPHVIHAVGPVWQGGGRNEAQVLCNAYRSALRVARDHSLRSVAFPAISTGIYRFPLEQAARIAVRCVAEWLAEEPEFDEVLFAVISDDAERTYRRALALR